MDSQRQLNDRHDVTPAFEAGNCQVAELHDREEPSVNLLIVESDPSQVALIELIFKNQTMTTADLSFVHSLQEAKTLLRENRFDLVIADLMLPDGHGSDLLQMSFCQTAANLPLLLLVGHGEQAMARDLLNHGVIDYIVKTDTSLRNLPRSVTRALREWSHIRRRLQTEEALNGNRKELLTLNKQLQQTLRQVAGAKEEWEQTMDCLDDVVILTDTSGFIRRANDALMTLTGRKYDDLIGVPLADIFAEFQIGIQDPPFREVEMYHPESGRWFILTTYNLDGIATETGIVIKVHDYTRMRQLNLQLEQTNAELQLKSLALEQSLAQQQATQAKILHQEKMATIGQLAAGVAHEINNPMGFILSNLCTIGEYLTKLGQFVGRQNELLAQHLDPGQRQALESYAKEQKIDMILEDLSAVVDESIDGAERVRKIVSALKGFTRHDDTGAIATDVNEILENSISLIWNEIKYKAILSKDLRPLPEISCHQVQLSQVFMNLLVNAGQAIEQQGEIQVTSWCNDDGWINIAITDNGQGIPASVTARIFEPFFTTRDVGKGTGLGLSIAYDIIKEHGGEIRVDSRPGQGSTFTVRLPAKNC